MFLPVHPPKESATTSDVQRWARLEGKGPATAADLERSVERASSRKVPKVVPVARVLMATVAWAADLLPFGWVRRRRKAGRASR